MANENKSREAAGHMARLLGAGEVKPDPYLQGILEAGKREELGKRGEDQERDPIRELGEFTRELVQQYAEGLITGGELTIKVVDQAAQLKLIK